MKRFTVDISQRALRKVSISILAESEDEACEKAIAIVEDEEKSAELDWDIESWEDTDIEGVSHHPS